MGAVCASRHDGRMSDDAAVTGATRPLVCLECGDESTVGHGWQAYLLGSELLVYCPSCAAHEFDDDG